MLYGRCSGRVQKVDIALKSRLRYFLLGEGRLKFVLIAWLSLSFGLSAVCLTHASELDLSGSGTLARSVDQTYVYGSHQTQGASETSGCPDCAVHQCFACHLSIALGTRTQFFGATQTNFSYLVAQASEWIGPHLEKVLRPPRA